MKNFKYDTSKFNEHPINVVLFVSRNKDNSQIEGFKERRRSFITHEPIDSEVLKTKFAEFVYSGVSGELCRFYYSINERDPEKIHKFLIHFLIDNEDFNICDIQPKLASIAAKKECARSKRWMFDFDIDDDALVNEFIEDIKAIDFSIEVNKYKTPHGYGVIVSHGFDTRTLYEQWDRSKTECKKVDLMCIDWKIKK